MPGFSKQECCSARQHVPVPEFKQNLQSMVEHLREANIDSIILIAPPPVFEEGRIQHNCQVHVHKPSAFGIVRVWRRYNGGMLTCKAGHCACRKLLHN